MNLNTMSPAGISLELGQRLKRARLNADITQAELAKRTGLNRRTILNAEKGKVQLVNLIAILAVLDLISQLNTFLPDQQLSPLQLAKLKGRERKRASGKSAPDQTPTSQETTSW
jgi:transcriptional regulator with XRE-family HTH domain